MPTYRWTVPPRLLPAIADDPSSVPERVTAYLAANGLTVSGVSIENRVTIESFEGFQYLDGPFLRVAASADPSALLDAVDLPIPAKPNLTAIKSFLATVDAGNTPTNAATLAAVVALCRAFMSGRGSL